MKHPPREGRPLKDDSDAQVFLSLNRNQIAIINARLATGCYGNTATQATMRLLDESLLKYAGTNGGSNT